MNRSAITLLLIFMMNACTHVEPSPFQEYLALAKKAPAVGSHRRVQSFIRLYDNMKIIPLENQLVKTYAEKFYFNDTVVTLHDRSALLKYLIKTQKNVDSINFKVLDVLDNGDDSYIRWQMQTRFSVMGQERDVRSIGMSHLKFNKDDKIICHQDYWDSMQGFYQHLPLIGRLLIWVRNSLAED